MGGISRKCCKGLIFFLQSELHQNYQLRFYNQGFIRSCCTCKLLIERPQSATLILENFQQVHNCKNLFIKGLDFDGNNILNSCYDALNHQVLIGKKLLKDNKSGNGHRIASFLALHGQILRVVRFF